VEICVLGPLEVRVNGAAAALGGPKQRAVLAMLLLHGNEVVSRDRLVNGVWGERPPEAAQRSLDSYVSRLRAILGADRIERRAPGYVVRLEPGELDLERFETLLEEGRAAAANGDAATASEALRQALGLWHGPALADLLYEPFAADEAGRLEERRMLALEERIDADLALGGGPELVSELERLVSDEPFRQRLLGQLMVSLYRAGRQADALAAYEGGRQRLAEELGLEPGPQLRLLERQILDHDPALGGQPAPPRPDEPPGQKGRVARHSSRSGYALLMVVVIALSVALGLWLAGSWRGRSSTALVGVNHLGVLSTGGKVLSDVSVGGSPAGVADGGGATWVSNSADGTVSRVEAGSNSAQPIQVGADPTGVAFGARAVWVTNSGGRTVSRIDPATDSPTPIETGNGPTAAVVSAGGVWVANAIDGTVVRISTASLQVSPPILVGAAPSALAAGFGSIWVANASDDTVSKVDPATRRAVDSINVGGDPTALAVAGGSIWVANRADGTVSRIDPRNDKVKQTRSVGRDPRSLASAAGLLWVGVAGTQTLTALDPRTGSIVRSVRIDSLPAAIGPDGGRLFVATDAGPAAHRGGTLRIVAGGHPDSIDPAVDFSVMAVQIFQAINDGLVGFRRANGAASYQVVPDLAVKLPRPSPDGRTYTFQMRPGIHYSTGQLVQPQDIRTGLERMFRLGSTSRIGVTYLYSHIVGAGRCLKTPGRCDLRRGIVADDSASTVTFRLTSPDPDFLVELALPFATAVPAGVPLHIGTHPLPATGPYRISHYDPRKSLVLVRNPHFHQWSTDAQPPGFVNRIKWTFLTPRIDQFFDTPQSLRRRELKSVERGHADIASDPVPLTRLPALRRSYPTQVHTDATGAASSLAIFFNTYRPPFNSRKARQAVNYAIDRNVTRQRWRLADADTTCQILPTGFPGYQPYCPYTIDQSPVGTYTGPNLARAQRLVSESHTRGETVTFWSWYAPWGRYITRVLNELGYKASVREVPFNNQYVRKVLGAHAKAQIGLASWEADYPTAGDYFALLFRCNSSNNYGGYCNHRLDTQIARAASFQGSDSAAADARWAQIDHQVTDQAIWAPLITAAFRTTTFVGPRVGNYTNLGFFGTALGQLWVR
jgi:peptide/nickel transport system substrate-binding protein